MPAPVNSFEALYQTETLSGLVQRFAQDAVAGRPYLAEFMAPGVERIAPMGDSVHWDEIRLSRGLAPLKAADSPTESAKKTDLTVRSGVMFDIKENVDLPARFLYLMRDAGSMSDNARAKIDRELENMTRRVLNTLEWVCTLAMEGSVDLSTFPGVSDLTQTLTYPILSLTNPSASWATNTTKILSTELPALVDEFIKKANKQPVRAIAHRNVFGFIAGNDEVTNLIQSGPALAGRALESSFTQGGGFAPQLGQLAMTFTNAHYALDASPDTETEYKTVDLMTVLPSPAETAEALAWAEGRVHVPAGPSYGEVGGAPTNLLREERGLWSYAEVRHNPPGIRLHCGWKGLPIVKGVNCIGTYNTTP